MTIFVDPTATFDYILKRQRALPDDQRVTWKLRPLVGRAALQALSMPDMKRAELLLDRNVVSWSDGGAKSEALPPGLKVADCLPANDAMELAFAILQTSGLTEADRGNSESPPTA